MSKKTILTVNGIYAETMPMHINDYIKTFADDRKHLLKNTTQSIFDRLVIKLKKFDSMQKYLIYTDFWKLTESEKETVFMEVWLTKSLLNEMYESRDDIIFEFYYLQDLYDPDKMGVMIDPTQPHKPTIYGRI